MPDQQPHLRRAIGKLGYGAITINGLIGGGIFFLPAGAIARAGDFSPWMFLLTALIFVSVVLAFARAASFFDDTGGPIRYAGTAFGPFVGFQAGWLLYLGRIAAMGANTNLLVTYAAWFWAPLDGGWARALMITVICAGLTWANVVGVRRGMAAVFALTVMKLIPLLAVISVGLAQLDADKLFGAELPAPDTLGETILFLLYAYIGFEGAVIPAGEGRNPRRDIPIALLGTLGFTTLLYVLIQAVAISADAGALAESERPLAALAEILMGTPGALLLSAGAVLSIAGNISAMYVSAPRMTYALAEDGSLPAWFARVHPRYRTPANSVVFIGALGLLLALTGSFVWLALMATLARLLTYLLSIAAIPVLQRKLGEREHQFRLPGGAIINVIAVLVCLWLLTEVGLKSWLVTALFAVIGSALFFWARHRRVSGEA